MKDPSYNQLRLDDAVLDDSAEEAAAGSSDLPSFYGGSASGESSGKFTGTGLPEQLVDGTVPEARNKRDFWYCSRGKLAP